MSQLTDLPNIGATLSDKLEAIGVTNRNDLMELGSVEALIRIGAANGSGCYNMLYALEGAIQGIRWHSLPQPVRQELKRQLENSRKRQSIMLGFKVEVRHAPNTSFQRTLTRGGFGPLNSERQAYVDKRHTLYDISSVKYFSWNPEKNRLLQEARGISFEEVVFHIERGDVLDILEHPNQKKYSGQRIMIVDVEGYAYIVPFVEDEHDVFLKTIIPSRKATRDYLGGG